MAGKEPVWAVTDPAKADLIFITGLDFALWCVRELGETRDWLTQPDPALRLRGRGCATNSSHAVPPARAYVHTSGGLLSSHPAARKLMWKRLLEVPIIAGATGRALPVVLVHTNNECSPPWALAMQPPPNILKLHTQDRRPRPFDRVIPFAIASPDWLVGDAPPPAVPRWPARRLLFFAGHVPKLYISSTRFKIWQQLWNQSGVTVLSSTIDCTVGSFDICTSPQRIDREYATFCTPPQSSCRPKKSKGDKCASSPSKLRHLCLFYRQVRACAPQGLSHTDHGADRVSPITRPPAPRSQVNWPTERAAMRLASRSLPRGAFLALAAAHKFFLVAPGDFTSTRKVAEAMALGGAAGTLPLFVVPRGGWKPALAALPYSSWLDYCSAALFVAEATIVRSMPRVLAALRRLSTQEHARRQRQLRRLWRHFVFRRRPRDGTGAGLAQARGDASGSILAEACSAARAFTADRRRSSLNSSAASSPTAARRLAILVSGTGTPSSKSHRATTSRQMRSVTRAPAFKDCSLRV